MGNKTSAKIQKIESFLNDHFDIRFNTITNLVEARFKEEVCFSEVNEKSIYRSLHHHGIRASIQEIQILLGSDFVARYNPIQAYFEKISNYWSDQRDGDYIGVLSEYVCVKDQLRFFRHFKKWMVRSVACSLLPSYYNKSAMILVGEQQDTGKLTTSLKVIQMKVILAKNLLPLLSLSRKTLKLTRSRSI